MGRNSDAINHMAEIADWNAMKCRRGTPVITDLAETVEVFIGGSSIKEMKGEIGARGLLAEVPASTYGYLRSDKFYHRSRDGDLINEWVIDTMEVLVNTDRPGGIRDTEHSYAKY